MMKKQLFNRILHLLEARPQQGKRMIGLGGTALGELWQRIALLDQAAQQQQARRLGRKRQSGGGRKKEADVLCRLLVTLLSLRQHWTMQAVAESIGCCEATVWNYIHERLPYIRDELPASLLAQWQPACDSVERAELAQWLAKLPAGEWLVDTWEQPIPRPQDNEGQAAYYSGKKKHHCAVQKATRLNAHRGSKSVQPTGESKACACRAGDPHRENIPNRERTVSHESRDV